jgi:RecG-like helicase
MRFEGTKLSKDKETTIYSFSMGMKEVQILSAITEQAWKNIPGKILDLQPTKARMHNMVKQFKKAVEICSKPKSETE